jgi:hypothetical protein
MIIFIVVNKIIRLDSYNFLKNNSKINNYYRTAFVLEKKISYLWRRIILFNATCEKRFRRCNFKDEHETKQKEL